MWASHDSQSAGVSSFFYPFTHVDEKGVFIPDKLTTVFVSVVFIDWLDDVELAGVCSGSGSLSGFIWRFTANAHTQCTVEPDRPAGVCKPHTHAQMHKHTHKRERLPEESNNDWIVLRFIAFCWKKSFISKPKNALCKHTFFMKVFVSPLILIFRWWWLSYTTSEKH